MSGISHALRNIPPAPCDTCPAYSECARERLACGQYRHYIRTGKIRRDIPLVPTAMRPPESNNDEGD